MSAVLIAVLVSMGIVMPATAAYATSLPDDVMPASKTVEQAATEAIIAGVEAYEDEIDLQAYGLSVGDVGRIYHDAVVNDGRFFWVEDGEQMAVRRGDEQQLVISLLPNYSYAKQVIPAMRASFEEALDEAASWVPAGADDLTKAKVAHDFVLARCSYDWSCPGYPVGGNWDSLNAYGALVRGSGVCRAYATAYNAVARRLGLPNGSTSIFFGNSHAWNAVKVDGDWFLVDTTWDDTSGEATKYFMKSPDYLAGIGDTTHILGEITECSGNEVIYGSTRYDAVADWPVYDGPAGTNPQPETYMLDIIDGTAEISGVVVGGVAYPPHPVFQLAAGESIDVTFVLGVDKGTVELDLVQGSESGARVERLGDTSFRLTMGSDMMVLVARVRREPAPDPTIHALKVVASEGVDKVFVGHEFYSVGDEVMVAEGTSVELAPIVADGYAFEAWAVVEGGDSGLSLTPYSQEGGTTAGDGDCLFTMGSADVTLAVQVRKTSTPEPEKHTLRVMASDGLQALTVDGTSCRLDYVGEMAQGEKVYFVPQLVPGYVFESWDVVAGEGTGFSLEEPAHIMTESWVDVGSRSFTMGSGDVTLVMGARKVDEPRPARHMLRVSGTEGITSLVVNGTRSRLDYEAGLSEGEQVVLEVGLADGYEFVAWEIVAGEGTGCLLVPGNGLKGEAILTMGTGDVHLVALARQVEGPAPEPTGDRWFDINFLLDGEYAGDQGGMRWPFEGNKSYGTFDFAVVDAKGNTVISRAGIDDFVGSLPVGATWEITNVRTAEGKRFDAEGSGKLSGVVTAGDDTLEVILKFDTVDDPATKHTVTLVAVDGIDHFVVGGEQAESVELSTGERVRIGALRKEGYKATTWMFGDWTNGGATFEEVSVDTADMDAIDFTMGNRDVTLLAMAYVPTCSLDINFLIDGRKAWDQSEVVYGTFDLSIVGPDGETVYEGKGIDDYVGGVPLGSAWAITNVEARDGYRFSGAAEGDLSGTVDEDDSIEIVLAFDKGGMAPEPLPDPETYSLVLAKGEGVKAIRVDGTEKDSVAGLHVCDELTLTAELEPGYAFEGWKLVSDEGNCRLEVPEALDARGVLLPARLVMGAGDVVVQAAATKTYSLSVEAGEGVATVGASRPLYPMGWSVPSQRVGGLYPGEPVELSATSLDGFANIEWKVVAGADGGATIERHEDGTAYLVMGASDIELVASARPIAVAKHTVTLMRGSYVSSFGIDGKTTAANKKVVLKEGSSTKVVVTPKEGKAVTGWNTSAGWTMEPVEGEANTWLLTAGSANAKLSPKGRSTRHTLKLTKGTGVAAVLVDGEAKTSIVLEEGQSVALGYELKANYEFAGWSVTKGKDTDYGWMQVSYQIVDGDVPAPPEHFVMGVGNVTIKATASKVPGGKLSIAKTSGISSVSAAESAASLSFVRQGTHVVLRADVKDGYVFAGWVVTKGDATLDNPSSQTATVTMGSKASTVKATVRARHTLRLAKGTGVSSIRINGRAASSLTLSEGCEAEIAVVMKKGYLLADFVTALGEGSGYSIDSIPGKANAFRFVMGTQNVKLNAVGEKAVAAATSAQRSQAK